MKEAEIERYLVREMRKLGATVRKVQWIGVTGAPDRVVLLSGFRMFWVELKAPHGKVSMRQIREHRMLRDHGQIVHVLRSKQEIDFLVAGLKVTLPCLQ